jgi:hypothetical protein
MKKLDDLWRWGFLRGKVAFDFAAAVEEARRDYPAETQDVTFIDGSKRNARKKLAAWFNATSSEYKNILARNGASINKIARETLAESSNKGFAFRDPVSRKKLVIVPTRQKDID